MINENDKRPMDIRVVLQFQQKKPYVHLTRKLREI